MLKKNTTTSLKTTKKTTSEKLKMKLLEKQKQKEKLEKKKNTHPNLNPDAIQREQEEILKKEQEENLIPANWTEEEIEAVKQTGNYSVRFVNNVITLTMKTIYNLHAPK